jgi:1,4-dihydroxy-2-naphthoate octaprenyltransferase
MPVFFFSLSQVPVINYGKATLAFVILHFIMYPASNGYNSYMDRDEESIGMLEKPPMATKELFYVTLGLDVIAVILSFFINTVFASCIIANILASRAYSYRGIRLKKYPITGFLTVILFQGAITYFMVHKASSVDNDPVPWMGMAVSSLLFGGFYPLTQVYQHEQDYKDGVRTISYLLGVRGTFIFSEIMYILADFLLLVYFNGQQKNYQFWLMQLFFLPIVIYFISWWRKVLADRANASFSYAMRMNMVAATSVNCAFILLYLLNHVLMK